MNVHAVHGRKVDVLLVGFSCISASRLNQLFISQGCTGNIECETGNTLLGAVLSVSQKRPFAFICENVIGLMDGDMHLDVKTRFERVGYFVVFKVVCSHEVKVPQARWRIYFMGFDLSAVRCIADLSGLVESTYSQLIAQGCGGDVLPLDSFLLQEGPLAVSSDEWTGH